jgi:hypothetical protein
MQERLAIADYLLAQAQGQDALPGVATAAVEVERGACAAGLVGDGERHPVRRPGPVENLADERDELARRDRSIHRSLGFEDDRMSARDVFMPGA